MAWVTRIVTAEQVEYRLARGSGCWGSGPEHPHAHNPGVGEADAHAPGDGGEAGEDRAVEYRMQSERPLRWWGSGLTDFPGPSGPIAGAEMGEQDIEVAKAMLSGTDLNGNVLLKQKLAIDPKAKLSAHALIAEIRARHAGAIEGGARPSGRDLQDFVHRHTAAIDDRVIAALPSANARSEYRLYARNADRRGELYTAPADRLERLAELLGVDAEEVYGDELARAYELGYRQRRTPDGSVREARRVPVGVRAFEYAADLPKSHSILMAYAPEGFASEYEGMLDQALHEALAQLEAWTAYGQRGHHGRDKQGEFQRAARVATSGHLGWIAIHRAARPVDGAEIGDPHWHAHVVISNLGHGEDGKWSAVASGGRDIYRHAHAVDALFKARARYEARTRYGIVFRRTAVGAWDIAAIPEATIRLFSKRDSQVKELFNRLHLDYDEAELKSRKLASAASREAKTHLATSADDNTLRGYWQAEGRDELGDDPDEITALALGEAEDGAPMTVEEIAALVFDPETGLTSHTKRFDWTDAYAAVLEALPGGIASAHDAEDLLKQVLAFAGMAVPLAARVPEHMTHPECFTTQDVVAAERTVLALARTGYGQGRAVIDQERAERVLAGFEAARGPGFHFSAEQRHVYFRSVRAGHGFDAIIGVAGAGKTTLMSAVRAAFEDSGLVVEGTSTAAIAVDGLRRTAGLATARTLASYLASLDKGFSPLSGVDVLMVDEAAMADDRDMARLLTHAAQVGTKVIGIGDPAQLRSPGIGGTFAAVHQVVGGTVLSENRRQRDQVEQRAVALLRGPDYPQPIEARKSRAPAYTKALQTMAGHDRLHVGRTRDDAMAATMVIWQQARGNWADPHDQVENVLVMAATNSAVDRLNAAGRALRRDAGELTGIDRAYHLPGGRELALAVGDIVLVRHNDYRERDDPAAHDVYNGIRGVVDAIAPDGTATVSWREHDADGTAVTVTETLDAEFICHGGVSHGIAITGHKSQGVTTEIAIAYGDGMGGNALYEAATRGRTANHLLYSQEAYEDAETRARLGEADTHQALTARTIAAVAEHLAEEQPESLVSVELGFEDLGEHSGYLIARPNTDPPADLGSSPTEDPEFDLDEVLARVPQLTPADLVALATDEARPRLADRLRAHLDHEGDPAELLSAVLREGGPLSGAHSPAAVLIARIDRHNARTTTLPERHERPTDPSSRLERWAHTQARTREVKPRDAVMPDDKLEAALYAARDAAHTNYQAHLQAQPDLAALRSKVNAGRGPAARRLIARHANLRGRGEALAEIEALEHEARPLRDELASLRTLPAPTPAQRGAMREIRTRLNNISARTIELDNVAGAPTYRPQILDYWRALTATYDSDLTAARQTDARRLTAMTERLPKLEDLARRSGERYADLLAAAHVRDLRLSSPAGIDKASRTRAPRPAAPARNPQPNRLQHGP